MTLYRLWKRNNGIIDRLIKFHTIKSKNESVYFFSNSIANINDSNSGPKYKLCSLPERQIISVSGDDAKGFLQGLTTNNIDLLEDECSKSFPRVLGQYSLILNNLGRIVCDVFIYKLRIQSSKEFLLEIDTSLSQHILDWFAKYKIRRRVNIRNVPDYKIFALFPSKPEDKSNFHVECIENGFVLPDPRNQHFGYRILSRDPKFSPSECLNAITTPNEYYTSRISSIECVKSEEYTLFRYQHGIGEGAIDFPIETALPFEANADLLNGISFNKGCYIGQELTARTYHTGVIRKRLMPIEIITEQELRGIRLPSQKVVNRDDNRAVGRFCINWGHYGLAKIRFEEMFGTFLGADEDTLPVRRIKLSQSGYRIRTFKPFWWPYSFYTIEPK